LLALFWLALFFQDAA